MSGELVKTALADRLSIKPLQSVPVPSRLRSGCRMMCPAGCLSSSVSCAVPRLACLPLSHPLRSSVSSCLFSLCLLTRSAFLPVSRVAERGVLRFASRHVFCLSPLRACLPFCVPLILGLRLWMSSPCFCVPLLLCRLCLVSPICPAYSCREAGRCRAMRSARVLFFFLWDFCEVGCFPRRVRAIMCAVAMGTSE